MTHQVSGGMGLGAGGLQGQSSGILATVAVRASDQRGQHQFLPGQLSAGPRRARHLGTRLTRLFQGKRPPWVSVCMCVKQVSVVTRPEPEFHCYLHRESHLACLL